MYLFFHYPLNKFFLTLLVYIYKKIHLKKTVSLLVYTLYKNNIFIRKVNIVLKRRW